MKGRPLTKQQRERLISIYLQRGYQAVKPLAVKHGIAASTIADVARKRGHFKRPVVSEIRRSRAAMWERAKQNGALVR